MQFRIGAVPSRRSWGARTAPGPGSRRAPADARGPAVLGRPSGPSGVLLGHRQALPLHPLEARLAVDVARKTFARRAAAFVKQRSRPIISVIAIVVVSSKVTSKTLVMRALYLAREASRARED